MSEKKTFKITSPGDGQILHDTDEDWYACCGHIFELSEWDIEVTFTKKEDPFRVNDQVILTGGGELAIIWHIIADRAWVNVVASSGGSWRDSHHVVKLSELKHAS